MHQLVAVSDLELLEYLETAADYLQWSYSGDGSLIGRPQRQPRYIGT